MTDAATGCQEACGAYEFGDQVEIKEADEAEELVGPFCGTHLQQLFTHVLR